MVLIIDNYDSFSYNIYQYIGLLCGDVKIVRNDKITIEEIRNLAPSHLVLSPGPGFPKDAGVCINALQQLAGEMPILGVCLGHQAIGEAFGGKVIHAPVLMHGKACEIKVDNSSPLFYGLPSVIKGARYHSLVLQKETLPDCLRVTATEESGQIMALEHKNFQIYSLQFHPESFLTEYGYEILGNFLKIGVNA